jgi:DNA-binding transcriptional regulator LsrR (DeoR family)
VRPDPRRIVQLVGASLGLHAEEITSRRRNRSIRAARIAVVHTALATGLTGSDVAATLGISQQAVSAMARNAKRPPDICERVFDQLEREVRIDLKL